MRLPAAAALALALAAGGHASASDLVVTVKTGKGQPVADAVVTVEPSQARPRPARFAQPLRMTQRNLTFEPFVLVAPTGAEVAFPNLDEVRHQVYSFSPAKKFELKLYGREEQRVVKFDRPGTVALGCNIHDAMAAYIRVTDAPFAVKTDAQGRAVLRDLPAGAAVVKVWHPYLKAPGGELQASESLPAQGAAERGFTAELKTPPMRMSGY